MKSALVMAVALSTTAVAQAQRPCLTSPEAEALATVALPEIIRQTGVTCSAQLSAASPLRKTAGPMLTRYDAAADMAWPAARAAIVKVSDPTVAALLASDYARPLLSSLVAPMIVGRIATKDCGVIDRLVTLLEPLPPRNTAGVIVTTLQYLRTTKQPAGAKSPIAALPLCVSGGR